MAPKKTSEKAAIKGAAKGAAKTPVKAAVKKVEQKPQQAVQRSMPMQTQMQMMTQRPSGVVPSANQYAIQNPPLERPNTLRDGLQRDGQRDSVLREQKVLPPRPRQQASLHIWKYLAGTIVCAVVVGVAVWYFFVDTLTAEQKRQEYVSGIVTKIAKLVLIPPGETPTIGVIPDPANITENKEFFKNASQGDYLVVFPNARLMLIYNPTKNIVINMGYAEGAVEKSAETNKDKKSD